MSEHTISQLSALSGLPVRTIRYYLAQGLIPAVGKEGPGTRYPQATLARLRLIARLRDAHLPLAEIRKQLLALSDDQVLELAGTPAEPEPAGTALDYVRQVLGGSRPELTSLQPPAAAPALRARRIAIPPVAAPAPVPAPGSVPAPAYGAATALPSAPAPAAASAPAAAPAPGPTTGAHASLLQRVEAVSASDAPPPPEDASSFGQRSQWERVSITSDIELHVRRPLSRRDNRLVERLLAFARQLEEDQP